MAKKKKTIKKRISASKKRLTRRSPPKRSKSKKRRIYAKKTSKSPRRKRAVKKTPVAKRKPRHVKKTVQKKRRVKTGSTRTFQLDRDFKRRGKLQFEVKEITVARDNPRLGISKGDRLEIQKYTFTFERPKKFKEGQRIDLRDAALRKSARIFKSHGAGAYFARAGFSMRIKTDQGPKEVKRWFPIARRECKTAAELHQYIRDFFLSFTYAMKHYVLETDERSFSFTDFDLEYFPLS